jgi:hypothetical protein
MPRVTLSCPPSADAEEERLSEYICDVPGCPNIAEHALGVIRELRTYIAVCSVHAPPSVGRSADEGDA